MAIGINQILKRTPDIVKHIRATLIYAIASSLVFTSTLATKFGVTPLEYAEWCGIAMWAIKVISMLFGVSDEKEVQQAVKTLEEKAPEVLSTNGPGGSTLPPPEGLPKNP